MMKHNRDLLVAISIAIANLFFLVIPTLPQWVQIIPGIAVTLFLPGYTVLAATIPTIGRSWSERLLLSIGLSMVFTIIGGLILNSFSVGLRPETWSLLFTIAIAGFSIVAMLRRRTYKRATNGNPASYQHDISQQQRIPLWIAAGLILILATIITSSYSIARQAAVQQSSPGFTQTWIVPGSSNSTTIATQIGINNHEHAAMTYTVNIQENGVAIVNIPNIVLADNTTWTYTAQFPRTGSPINVTVAIYRDDQPNTIYRTVNITMDR